VPSVRTWHPEERILRAKGREYTFWGAFAVTNCPTGQEASARRRSRVGSACSEC